MKVYEDENIKLYRQDQDYDIKTKDLSRQLSVGYVSAYGLSFSVKWENVVSMYSEEYALAA